MRALVASLCGVVNYVVFFPASGCFLPFIASMLADSTASPRRVENEVTSTKTNLALLLYIRDLVTDRSSPDHDFLVVVACQSPVLSPSPSPPPSSVNSPTVTPLLRTHHPLAPQVPLFPDLGLPARRGGQTPHFGKHWINTSP